MKNKNIAGFLIEPIQREAGVFVPDKGYLKKYLRSIKSIKCFSLLMKSRPVLLSYGENIDF
ncbi:MAG: hypothetical protein ACMUEM_01835 [Flavobacteriales bacterium AspAUS03]